MPDKSRASDEASAAKSVAMDTGVDRSLLERQSQQISDLQGIAERLVETLAGMQAQQARDAVFNGAVTDLRNAANAVAAAPGYSYGVAPNAPLQAGAVAGAPATAAAAAAAGIPAGVAQGELRGNCDCGPCECVGSDCCSFNIHMTYVRCLAMQPLELDDSNANPWSELEIQLFAYLEDGTGAVVPSLFSSLSLRKLANYVGLKVTVDRKIGQVTVRKGSSKVVKLFVDAVELDSGLVERLTGGRDEEGQSTGSMVLDCCCSAEPTAEFEVNFTSGGLGGGTIGVGFAARRAC